MSRILTEIKKCMKAVLTRQPKCRTVYIPVLQTELLKGRRALVTGGTSGIGFAIAEAFLSAGAKVVITGRNGFRLDSAKERLSKNGSVETLQLDNAAPETFAVALDQIGSFDILVNNAGYVGGGVFGDTMLEEYDKVLDTNLRGAYFLSQEVSKRWIKESVQGNILNVCSASSLRPGNSPYILSKWGLRSLTVGMACDLVKYGIVVNGIAPGITNTERFCKSEDDISFAPNPSGRMVTVQEIANLAVVMVSSLARMVVGDILFVTGGGAITTLDD